MNEIRMSYLRAYSTNSHVSGRYDSFERIVSEHAIAVIEGKPVNKIIKRWKSLYRNNLSPKYWHKKDCKEAYEVLVDVFVNNNRKQRRAWIDGLNVYCTTVGKRQLVDAWVLYQRAIDQLGYYNVKTDNWYDAAENVLKKGRAMGLIMDKELVDDNDNYY